MFDHGSKHLGLRIPTTNFTWSPWLKIYGKGCSRRLAVIALYRSFFGGIPRVGLGLAPIRIGKFAQMTVLFLNKRYCPV